MRASHSFAIRGMGPVVKRRRFPQRERHEAGGFASVGDNGAASESQCGGPHSSDDRQRPVIELQSIGSSSDWPARSSGHEAHYHGREHWRFAVGP